MNLPTSLSRPTVHQRSVREVTSTRGVLEMGHKDGESRGRNPPLRFTLQVLRVFGKLSVQEKNTHKRITTMNNYAWKLAAKRKRSLQSSVFRLVFGQWPWKQTGHSRTFALYLQKMLIKTAFKSLFTDSFELMIIQLSLCKPPPTLVVYI